MNRKEYLSTCKRNNYYKQVQKLLKDWKLENNITERCDVHHRDDTEEALEYNNNHYELWGFNEDGTFELGKYVLFMTAAEHAYYHHIGNKNHMYGKHHTNETRARISATEKGRMLTEEHKAKISAAKRGKTHTEEAKAKISAANRGRTRTEEHKSKISAAWKGKKRSEENKAKMRENMIKTKALYAEHKNNGGTLSWNEFQKYLKEISNG